MLRFTNLVLPNRIKKIELRSFSECSSLQAIVIPPFVKVIDNYAFSGCSQLMNVELPDVLLKEIGNCAFIIALKNDKNHFIRKE